MDDTSNVYLVIRLLRCGGGLVNRTYSLTTHSLKQLLGRLRLFRHRALLSRVARIPTRYIETHPFLKFEGGS
jgi:hypothetical protein